MSVMKVWGGLKSESVDVSLKKDGTPVGSD
jgi:hypothetical protein